MIKINVERLEKELQMLDLKGISSENLCAQLERRSGERFSVLFEMHVGRIPIMGHVYFALNETTGVYAVEYYELTLPDSAAAVHHEYSFPHEPWLVIRLDEAVNLMQGRFIYRKPEIGIGFWLALKDDRVIPSDGFQFTRCDFEVREYMAETGLGGWLGLSGWIKLVEELERGHRCDLAIGAGSEMRAVKVEACPLERRLRVMDRRGKELFQGEILF